MQEHTITKSPQHFPFSGIGVGTQDDTMVPVEAHSEV